MGGTIVYGYPSNIVGITTFDNGFGIINSKQFNLVDAHNIIRTLDNRFVVAGQYLLNNSNGDYRMNVLKVSYNNNSCIDTTTTGFSLSSLSLALNTLSATTATPSVVLSNFTVNPVLSNLIDTSICHQCNLTANITATGPTTFCSGDSVSLSADSGMASYLWSNGETSQVIYAKSTGNYSVAITDNYACPATSQSIAITVNALPYADAGTNQNICSGSSVILGTAQIQGDTYSWLPTAGLNNANIATPSASPTLLTTYTLKVSNAAGCSATDQVNVSVNQLPTIAVNATANSICQGNYVTLSGAGAVTYTWSNGVIDGVPFAPAASNTYSVTGTDLNGCSDTATKTIGEYHETDPPFIIESDPGLIIEIDPPLIM